MPGSCPSRHFERREDPGDEVEPSTVEYPSSWSEWRGLETTANPGEYQSRARSFSSFLSAVGRREKLRDNGISLNIL